MSKLFIISGPSGAGKGTLVDMIKKNFEDIFLSISMTTRQPRPGEQEGINYYYVSVDEFKNRISQDKMLEYAEYC
ncbi:MAG: guanylate kinase, partial [Clostridia bacterium]|nr:guanylate kinase [Clostridia bacterium]